MLSAVKTTYLLVIEYDGSQYAGWQIQPGRSTIQSMLETALNRLFGEHVFSLTVTGRTDAGVHALAQAASFESTKKFPPANIQQALNRHLPPDISISRVKVMPHGFNARRKAKIKTYEYRIWNRPFRSVWKGKYAWHVKASLMIPDMRSAAHQLTGQHDFSAFDAKNSVLIDKVARLDAITVTARSGVVTITVTGNRFLYKMVRNIVGTLVDVGSGKISPKDMGTILASKKRAHAGQTAPACGLFLKNIRF